MDDRTLSKAIEIQCILLLYLSYSTFLNYKNVIIFEETKSSRELKILKSFMIKERTLVRLSSNKTFKRAPNA